jgi:hypothetical protein
LHEEEPEVFLEESGMDEGEEFEPESEEEKTEVQ